MKNTTALCLCLCLLLSVAGCTVQISQRQEPSPAPGSPPVSGAGDVSVTSPGTPMAAKVETQPSEPSGTPIIERGVLPQDFQILTTVGGSLLPDFLPDTRDEVNGYEYFFNDFFVVHRDRFFWDIYDSGDPFGASCLMISLDTQLEGAEGNYTLMHPVYRYPFVGKYGSDINVIWYDDQENSKIGLTFQNSSSQMNCDRLVNGQYVSVEMVRPVFNKPGNENAFYVPLYAIVNTVGGGAAIDPFGDGFCFIFSGDAIQGYYGAWSTDGKYHSAEDIKSGGWNGIEQDENLQAIEINEDGSFTYTMLGWYPYDEEWKYTVARGVCAFSGRTLALKYQTISEYRGMDLKQLEPVMENLPFNEHETYNPATGGIYMRYVLDWTPEVLEIDGYQTLYAAK